MFSLWIAESLRASQSYPARAKSWGKHLTRIPVKISISKQNLLHRHALRQIARLVHVAPARHCRVIGEQLEGDDAEERLERLECVGDINDVIAVAAYGGVAFGGDGDDLAAAGADFFDVADHLVVLNALV